MTKEEAIYVIRKFYADGCKTDNYHILEQALQLAVYALEEKEQIIKELSIGRGYLQDWYQASIDETKPPIWTDEHLDELFADFYLIPKR